MTTPAPSDEPSVAPAAAAPVLAEVSLADVGLDAAAMDRTADPCTDFYQYACGGWMTNTKIPADKARYNRFTEIHERNEQTLKSLLEEARADHAAGIASDPVTAKLGAFYGACMDEAGIEKAGLRDIQGLVAKARKVRSAKDVAAAITELHRNGIWAAFRLEPDADFKDSSTTLLFVDTAGLGLPDRDYYLANDDTFAKAREFYRGHVERMMQLGGASKAAAARAAASVIKVETELAKVTKTRVERRDIPGLYNRYDRKALAALAPALAWDDYFAALGRPDLAAVSVTTPKYFERLNTLLASIKPAEWQSYLEWQILHSLAGALPKELADEGFALTKQLTGQPEQPPRWKRCIGATNAALGELVGQRFVAVAFPGKSKEQAESMIREISKAFAAELAALSWMDPKTKAEAMTKLEAMKYLIGYPAEWRVYDFEVDAGAHVKNVLAASAFEVSRQIDKADKPYDRSEWLMTPQTVNAYYSTNANQMAFPAGILQPPFFGAERSIAANMGAIGMVMGHELTHGFDDSGAQFDAKGNMRDWWQPQDGEKFREKGQCVVDEYNAFEPLPGVKVNGKLTLGENIADLGGVKLAFQAYRSMRKDATQRYVAEGLTEDQQFFVAVGQAWCTHAREAEVKRLVVVDTHSPPEFRVIGALRNTPEFAEAWSCAPGSRMRPENTCEVW